MTERREHPDRRDEPRAPVPGRRSSDHGTRACYQQGCGCTPCKAANAAYSLKYYHAKTPPLGGLVPAFETAIRLRQLQTEGFKKRDIARLLGLRRPILELHTEPGAELRLRTALKIRRLARIYLSEGGLGL